MTFIRKVTTKSGATAVQVVRKRYGRIVNLQHVGSAHTQSELNTLLHLAQKLIDGDQPRLFPEATPSLSIILKQTRSELLFQILYKQYQSLGLSSLSDDIFCYLCVARIVEPTSKVDSVRVLEELGIFGVSKDQVYRCLKKVVKHNYRSDIATLLFDHAKSESIHLVLYDVTTLYFEVQKEDEYRKPGMSKERRLEPQIVIGLLVDQHGFPLDIHSFEGNIAETNTILPVLKAFQKKHQISKITIVADAAMMSAKNLTALAEAGYTYVVGSRLQKIPYDIAEYQQTQQLVDNQIITTKYLDYRIIYQYKDKRAQLDIKNIEKQIAKAERIISGATPVKRAKFLSTTTKDKKLNQKLIEKARALVGIKGYVTNLQYTNEKVISFYHQLFQVEASFRMAKSDLKARPVFHRKRDMIEAHLTIVFTALAVSKLIEQKTKVSIKQFIKKLKPVRSGHISINGQEYETKAEIPTSVENILQKLGSGH
ncbi:IS1634 family transposase [Patescibacteria group bacterium]|nr:IS1634 family transposase [Patescibacteria group bacterium]